jgi:type IV fimbrial biogenesis protein FimT
MRKRSAGFNLVEIMIAMAIVAVMMALVAPDLRDFMRNAKISALTNDIMADLQMARTEAVKAKRRAWFCVSDAGSEGVCLGGGWTDKYRAIIVDLNDDGISNAGDFTARHKIADSSAGSPTATLSGTATAYGVTFLPSGVLGGGVQRTFRICDSRPGPNGVSASPFLHRQIEIEPSGRARVVQINCQ